MSSRARGCSCLIEKRLNIDCFHAEIPILTRFQVIVSSISKYAENLYGPASRIELNFARDGILAIIFASWGNSIASRGQRRLSLKYSEGLT